MTRIIRGNVDVSTSLSEICSRSWATPLSFCVKFVSKVKVLDMFLVRPNPKFPFFPIKTNNSPKSSWLSIEPLTDWSLPARSKQHSPKCPFCSSSCPENLLLLLILAARTETPSIFLKGLLNGISGKFFSADLSSSFKKPNKPWCWLQECSH